MALTFDDKKVIVTEVTAIAAKAVSAVAADYRGLTVAEITELRAKARGTGVTLQVVRNTLARRALAETEFACMREGLVGPMILAFSETDPGAPARLVRDFCKKNERLSAKVLALRGKLLSPDQLEAMAKLPTKEEAIAKLMATMQAPIAKFVRTLAEPTAKLARTLAAVRDQKQATV